MTHFSAIPTGRRSLPEILFVLTAFVLGLSLPISTAVMNLALAMVIVCLLLTHDASRIKALLKNPIVWLSAGMFLLLAVSLLWQHNSYALMTLKKYAKLLLILPLAMFFSHSGGMIKIFGKGFLLGNFLALAVSLWIGVTHLTWGSIDPMNPAVFKSHITHNFYMALAAVIWLSLAFHSHRFKRWAYTLLVCLAIYNIFFMVQGRTGYVAVATAFSIWFLLSLSWRQYLIVAVGAVLFVAVLNVVPNRAGERMELGAAEIQTCLTTPQQEAQNVCYSSMGLRTQFIMQALKMIKQAPIWGHGVGSFVYPIGEKDVITNAHNEYLMQALQSGGIGLALFVACLWYCLRLAWDLPAPNRNMMLALFGAYLVANLFNSLLLDSSEGHLFVILMAMVACCSTLSAKSQTATGNPFKAANH